MTRARRGAPGYLRLVHVGAWRAVPVDRAPTPALPAFDAAGRQRAPRSALSLATRCAVSGQLERAHVARVAKLEDALRSIVDATDARARMVAIDRAKSLLAAVRP